MTSQIHDGLYFANLVFLVGVAAGAVTIVFPAYVYHHKAMHEVTVLGEMLAISAVIMVMLFVFAHMGRPTGSGTCCRLSASTTCRARCWRGT
jgi:Ni/Fe-hydrogenase subunit HybB-like protein